MTFKYDKKTERGKAIAREILEAIEGSRFVIVVLSKNYAASRGGATLCIGGAMAPPKFFKTSLIIGKTRLESF